MSVISKLENEMIRIEVSSMGAELVSLKMKETDKEYMWDANPEFWSGSSPVLFPIVQYINEGTLMVDGKPSTIGNHGFARKTEFELETQTDSTLVYMLRNSEDTMKQYPYAFELRLRYTLDGSKVVVDYTVNNTDTNKIYFQLGTHAGFKCPINESLSIEDYAIKFNKEEDLSRLYCNPRNCIISDQVGEGIKGRVFQLSHETFYEGAHVFRNVNSDVFTLMSDKGQEFVEVTATNLPYLGIWQQKDAKFVCIEPWYGIGEMDNFNGEFKDKEMMAELDAGDRFEAKLEIRIG